jgi:hypothetical protein
LKKKTEIAEQSKAETRFWIVTAIILVLVATSLVASIVNVRNLPGYIMAVNFAVALWFVFDHSVVQYTRTYLYCLSLSVLIIALGLAVKSYSADEYIKPADLFSISPFSVLIVQWPLRMLYMKVFGVEPRFEGWSGSFASYVYVVVLMLAMITLPRLVL